ncbi:LysE family translocator [Tateyamaria omphalii]|uniref:LysE family translocator n=1 Tax=Tateyamaria omphalii TaxID=299262 RepID=UPI0021BD3CF9|nr:LysE family transporter [Tateyamaria omphalii]
MVAASGARSGIRSSMRFIYGLDGTYFLLALIMGLGLGQVLLSFPGATVAIKIVGITYIFYLAYRFMVASVTNADEGAEAFRFVDGVVVQLTNTKGLIMLVVMFSEFFRPSAQLVGDVLLMSAVLVLLNFCAHLIWVSFGVGIKQALVRNPRLFQAQNWLFAAMMAGVGVWLMAR